MSCIKLHMGSLLWSLFLCGPSTFSILIHFRARRLHYGQLTQSNGTGKYVIDTILMSVKTCLMSEVCSFSFALELQLK